MADLTISIGDTLNVLGPAATNKWNEFNWGESVWGASVDPQFDLFKYISDSYSASDAVYKQVHKSLSDTLDVPTDDTNTITVEDGSGYFYNFVDNVTDADDRSEETWANVSGNSASWSEVTDSSTSWGEV